LGNKSRRGIFSRARVVNQGLDGHLSDILEYALVHLAVLPVPQDTGQLLHTEASFRERSVGVRSARGRGRAGMKSAGAEMSLG